MNYLAHLSLSGENEEVLIGNYIGDSLKGIKIETFSVDIQKGIKLHRLIDSYTDSHPDFIKAKRFFTYEFDKYSGVLTDIFFDHFLAIKFEIYFNHKLQDFANKCYRIIEKKIDLLPENAKRFYEYMVKNNILFEYKNISSIKLVLNGLYHRIQYVSPLNESLDTFTKNYNEIEKLFDSFFPQLKSEAEKFLSIT